MDYFKNPIVLGILVSTICYLYLKWNDYQELKNNPGNEIENVNMKYPILLGIIVFLGMTFYNGYNVPKSITGTTINMPLELMASSTQPTVFGLGESMPKIFIETK